MTKVLNKRTDVIDWSNAVYVGRPTPWGNPFMIGKDGAREEVIEKFEEWFFTTELFLGIRVLKGKDLVCWCAPLPCHADILMRYANG